MNDSLPPTTTADPPADGQAPGTGRAVRPLLIGYVALGMVGFPIAGLVTSPELRGPALITGIVVVGIALFSVLPLWLSRQTPRPAAALNAVMGSLGMRLILTAGGLIVYLVKLPPELRRPAGLVAVGWFTASWIIELGILSKTLQRRPQATP
ncbi:MAG: hypothetical protein AAF797_10390 [Planctomycetota bacterium]